MVFEDDEFPASGESIGKSKHKHAKWARVGELDIDGGRKPTKLFGNIEADAIKQGELGDCWLLAAFACVADFPGHIVKLFNPNEYSEEGRYEVRLYDVKEGWVSVTIDDRVPIYDWAMRPCFGKIPPGGSVWVPLLEKAFAKFCGSYSSLDGGSPTWAYEVLTGITNQLCYTKDGVKWQQWGLDLAEQKGRADWRGDGMRGISLTSSVPVPSYSADELFRMLGYFDQGDCMISASIHGQVMEARRGDGLIESHAYSVLEVQKAHGKCMIKLRNPWGDSEWKGDFSDCSDSWDAHPELAQDLSREEEDDGSFWMTWEDFANTFNGVKVSGGTMSVPKHSRTGNKKRTDGVTCRKCNYVMKRVWILIDLDSEVHGKWMRLDDGDLCFMCRRAQTGLADFRPELQKIPGLDYYMNKPSMQQPEKPRSAQQCCYGCDCFRHNPEHFAEYDHPWLGMRKQGVPWKTDGPGHLKHAKTSDDSPDGKAHRMLNLAKSQQWDECAALLEADAGIVNLIPTGRSWGLIHRIASRDDVDVMRRFVEGYGADTKLPDGTGQVPLGIAERGGNHAVASYLRRRTAKDCDPDRARDALARGKRRKWAEALRIVLEQPAIVNYLPDGENFYLVHLAAYQGNVKVLQLLVEQFAADLTVVNPKGLTPLKSAGTFREAAADYIRSQLPPADAGVFATRMDSYAEGSQRPCEEDLAVRIVGDYEASPGDDVLAAAIQGARGNDWDATFAALDSCRELVDVRRSGESWALIHHAACHGDLAVVERLCDDYQADPGLLSAAGESPAEVGQRSGNNEAAAFLAAAAEAAAAAVAKGLRSATLQDFEEEDKVVEHFKRWDIDGNGFISKKELKAVLMTIMGDRVTESGIAALFKACDANTDGKISYEEFAGWVFAGA